MKSESFFNNIKIVPKSFVPKTDNIIKFKFDNSIK